MGFQTKYRGKFIIMSVWFDPSVNLDRFLKDEKIKVTKGVSTGYIKKAGSPEVVVTISGLDFNTPDQFVIDYLNKIGNVLNKQPIYCKGSEGFMKDKFNGTRKYLVDFSQSIRYMGSYHYLDGEVVRVSYRGNIETCGNCHKPARGCPGGAKKKECKQAGGEFVHISDHMKELWKEIDFSPTGFELPEIAPEDDVGGDLPLLDAESFGKKVERPVRQQENMEKYDGIIIKNFPLDLSESDILEFLFENGLPQTTDMNFVEMEKTHRNLKVIINSSLNWETVSLLLNNIDFHECQKKFFGVPLYCKPIRTLTPAKSNLVTPTPKVIPVVPEPRNTIPGMPESELRKADLLKKKRLKKKQEISPSKDFEFKDLEICTSKSNIVDGSDNSKRKDISPVQSEKNKMSKSNKC